MSMFRISGHLIEAILDYDLKKTNVLTFDTLRPDTKTRILKDKTTEEQATIVNYINHIGTGIHLSQSEYKLMLTLCISLYEKSETEEYGDDFYAGNAGVNKKLIQTSNGDLELIVPTVVTTIRELTKIYCGKNNIGGRNIKIVSQLLHQLAECPDKKIVIRYTSIVDEKKYCIESFRNIISVKHSSEDDGRLTIRLHPIFIHSIEGKYIEMPTDVIKNIASVIGHANMSTVMQRFLFEIFRASSNRTNIQYENGKRIYPIGEEKLLAKIAIKYRNKKTGKITRLKVVKTILGEAIKLTKQLGWIIDYQFVEAKKGYKYCFIFPDQLT
jgi:hypothetical protein